MALPQISVTALSNGREADASPVVFSFSRTGPTDAALSVAYQLFGTAKAGSDYSGGSTGTISFAVGSATASLSLPALADGALIDPGETIIARINPSESYAITPGKQFATATITAEGMVVSPKVFTNPGWSGSEAQNIYAFAALKSDGTVVAWGNSNNGGTAPTGLGGVTQIFSTGSAFAAHKADGTVVAWGDSSYGGTAPTGLSGVTQIFSNGSAFAALKSDGTVASWGDSRYGGTAPQGLSGVTQIFSTNGAFAALRSDGIVVAWGNSLSGGTAPTGLSDVTQIFSTYFAFAALKSDGTVVAWGLSSYGGTAPQGLSGVSQIFSTGSAFAALKSDGTVVAWGATTAGGTTPTGLSGVNQIFSNTNAFAALKSDGTVVAWGDTTAGGTTPTGLSEVNQIFSNTNAFAALKSDGTVVAWGDSRYGGTAPQGLSGVSQIFSTGSAFAALKSDGTVVAWGSSDYGGTAPTGLSGVTQIFSTDGAFAALKSDGTVVSWGNSSNGGTAPTGLGGVVGFANPYTDDRFTIPPNTTGAPHTPITIEGAGLIKVSSDSQGIYSVQSTLPSQLPADSVNAPKEQLGGGLIRQKYRDLGYGFESQSGDVLSVLYTGRLVDGTIFDSNTATGRSEFTFALGAGRVIQGFDLGLTGASLGDIYHLEIPASLGYGSTATGSIPANSTLLFDVEIRGISRGTSQLTYQNAIGNTVDTFALKKDGIPVHTGTLGSEWRIVAAERINEVNQVLWKNTLTNKLLVWAFDSSWNWTSSGALIDPSSGRGKEVESQFGVDINSDSSIFVYKTGTTSASVDVMTGSSSDEFFAPLGVGATGVDRIILGGGKNQIQLQASNGANLYANSKQSDFLIVEGFNALTDQLLLAPTQAYGSYPATVEPDPGLAIYEDKNKDKQYNINDDEVIAWLKGVTVMPAISFGAASFAVSGAAQVGKVLAVAKTADDPDGNGTFAYQWQSSTNGSSWVNIGANASTYTLTGTEQAKQIRVQVSYTDLQNFSESLTVAAGTVAAVNDGAATFAVSGTVQVGQVLTVAKTADDPDGNGTFTYQWQSSTNGSTWVNIGANASTYTLTGTEQAKQIRVQVSYTDLQNFSESLTVAAGTVAAVNDGAATFAVSGTAQVGQVLTVAKTADDPDGNGTLSYQWQSSTDGSTWVNIGANASTYTLAAAEQSKQIRVRVSYTDLQNFQESLTVPAGTVAAVNDGAATFAVSGTALVGQVLTVAKTADDPDGNGTFAYQWQSSADGSTWGAIGANAATYTLTGTEQAKQIRVQVSYTDLQNFSESLTVAAGTVAAANDGAATFAVSGTALVGQVLTVAKTADDPDGNGTFAYQWQSSTDGSTWVTIGANAATYTLTGTEQAKQIRVRVSYTDLQNFQESLTVAAGTVAAVNDGAATFAVSGTAQVGQVLTVAKTTDDPDGNGTFAYQWQSSTDGSTWVTIGANAATYTLTALEQSKQIRVRVSYTDGQNFSESLTVVAGTVAAVNDGAATFAVSGTAQVGQVLTVAKTADDPDGNGTFSYQWQSSTDGTSWGTIGSNAATYTLTSLEQSKQIRVRVSYTDGQSFSESLIVAAGTVAAVNDGAATFAVLGTAEVGQVLSVAKTADDPDGNGTFAYQWQSSTDGTTWSTIGANAATYSFTAAEQGKQIRVRVSYTDGQNFSESLTVAAGTVAAVNDGAATFAVSGTALVGQVLTVAKTADDPDGNGTFAYQWQSSTDGTTWSTIGANAATYSFTAAEQGKQIRVRVSYTDGQNFSESLTVAAGTVAAVNDGAATFAVSGTALVGQVLTVAKTADDPDGNGTFAYQWQSSTDGTTWGNIGANASTYTLTALEQSKQIRVRVSYTDGQNFSESLTVAAGTVAAVNDGAATFAVSGSAQVGQVLTVAKTVDDPDGNGTFTYQWQSSTDGTTWSTIGSNAASLTLTATDQSKQVRVRVSYTDGQNFSESLIVSAGTVAAFNDGAATFAVSGSALVGQVLTVAKTVDDPDGNGTFTYQWQSSTDGTTWGTIGANAATHTLTALEQSKQIRVRVSYTDGQNFSESLTVAAGTVPVYDARDLTYTSSTGQTRSARLTTTSGSFDGDVVLRRLDSSPSFANQNANLSIGKTGINFSLNLASSANSNTAKLAVDLAPLLDGVNTTQKRLAYFVYGTPVGQAAPMATPFTYDPVKKAGARFFDLDGNGSADTADLQFVDGGYGDKDGSKNGVVVDPSTAGAVDLNAIFTATATSLTVGDPTDTSSPAALVVRASLSSRSSSVNQIGYVALNANETLSLSYDLVKERGTLLFGTLSNNDAPDISKMKFQRDINLINGQKLMFFEVVDNTLEAMLKSGSLDSSFRTLDVSKQTDVSATAGKGGSILNLFLSTDVSGLGELISSQMGEAPIFDFSSLAGQSLTGDVLIAREASYDSTIGFYKLERSDGAVRDSLTNSLILPGEAGYAAAALRSTNLFSGFGSLATGNRTTKAADLAAFQDAGLLAPFARVANTGETYFSFAAANSDGLSHFRVLGSGVLGLEDIKGGGDRDFDDLVVGFNFKLSTVTLA